MSVEETLEWHERLIDRLIKTNADATISDYLKLTDAYSPKQILESEKILSVYVRPCQNPTVYNRQNKARYKEMSEMRAYINNRGH